MTTLLLPNGNGNSVHCCSFTIHDMCSICDLARACEVSSSFRKSHQKMHTNLAIITLDQNRHLADRPVPVRDSFVHALRRRQVLVLQFSPKNHIHAVERHWLLQGILQLSSRKPEAHSTEHVPAIDVICRLINPCCCGACDVLGCTVEESSSWAAR